jgi:hypothetical protein
LFDISTTTFHQIFNNIFVAISAGEDKRGGPIGSSTDKLVDLMSWPVVQKNL